MVIPAEVRSALVEHAEAELPNEACGLLVLKDGTAERFVPGRNRAASPYRFELEVDPETWFLEDEGYELAVFHSHPVLAAAAVADGRGEHRPLGGPPVRDPLAPHRRAGRVDDRGRLGRQPGRLLGCGNLSGGPPVRWA